MNWNNIKSLRTSGKLSEARELAIDLISANPNDFRAKSELEWVFFSELKLLTGKIKTTLSNRRPVDVRVVDEIMNCLVEYKNLQPHKPGMACSSILKQISSIAPHLPEFINVVNWVGIKGLRPEDWKPSEYQGKIYPSLAHDVARALCKWVKASQSITKRKINFALEWADCVRQMMTSDDALWLDWDTAAVLRKAGDFHRASEVLAGVIKAKKNEFWVWAEAGRLYRSEQPDLALACFCRALLCRTEPKFQVNVHSDLAELLAEQGLFAQASQEVVAALTLRNTQGWSAGKDLENLVASPWYDPGSTDAEDPARFYASHAQDALVLCFDRVETKPSTYLGVTSPPVPVEGQKPHKPYARFAVASASGAWESIIGPGLRNLQYNPGDPITIVTGRQEGGERSIVLHVSERQDGSKWDCTTAARGVVAQLPVDGRPMKVFLSPDSEARVPEGCWIDVAPLSLGQGVTVRLVRNPKNERAEVFTIEAGGLPESDDIKLAQGYLRRHPKGFGFIENAFVPPHLLDGISSELTDVAAVLVYSKHPKEDRYGWRAIALSAATATVKVLG